MRFSIVISTMRREASLEATLDSLQSCEPKPEEVIVVDADAEGSSQRVVSAFDRQVDVAVHYVRSQPGLTLQRNLGVADASGDVVVFLDDDVTIEPDLFARLEDAYRDSTIVGATGRVIEPTSHGLLERKSFFRRLLPGGGVEGSFTRYGYPRYVSDRGTPRDVEFMQGCFMSARREAAEKVRFDEHLSGYALAEDEDFSFRLSQLGRIRYLPEIVIHHRKLGFGSADERRFGRLVVVNRAYLFRKNFRRTPLARVQFAMLVAMLVGHRLVNREWRGAQGLIEGVLQVLRGRS